MSKTIAVMQPLHIANACCCVRHVFVRDLMLMVRIGIHAHERAAPQRIRVNLDLAVREDDGPVKDRLDTVVCYETILWQVRCLVADSHVDLVETLAEHIVIVCLQDTRVQSARVRVEKLDLFPDVSSVGVEIERLNHLA